ncbi:MAG: alpha-rhamnosidase [Clostridia bacterium]|nr:alpha-rhamnosidase [Clostridia bacterium]
MNKAKWIWYRGDFEIYHHMLLSCRRQEYGCDYPCQWHISRPEVSASFIKDFTAEKDGVVRVVTRSKGMIRFGGKLHPVNEEIRVPAGEHRIVVELYDIEKFPSFFIDSDVLVTDETWIAECFDRAPVPVGWKPGFFSAGDDPSVFPFEYADISPVSSEKTESGILYDFGKETFGPVTVQIPAGARATLVYGESRAEATDPENALVRETLNSSDGSVRPARAFRYIYVKSQNAEKIGVSAQYEYLPIEDRASFSCDRELVNRVWDLCAYTFHLNSREFFLDGIKRDRWVWSGDAYQSYMIARYLYGDPSVSERTIVALLGKPPYRTHVNTINDYSAYLIISVWEHYFAGGDKEFLRSVWPRVKELYAFIVSRLDENGFVVHRQGDWIFIDWGVLDKEGAHCAEQILLWRTHLAMAQLSEVLGEAPEADHRDRAEKLYDKIYEYFWDSEKGAFIDSFTSGRRFVTRQTNVFAVLFDFADGEKKESVIENAILDPDLPQITTPYFKLYELMALCTIGMLGPAQDYIESYWGGMLREGATSVWEAYDPTQKGEEHFAMYGSAFGKSLCHAWGSGPILLLSRWCAGVYPTSVGGETFRVEPKPGKYRSFAASVPIGSGKVRLRYSAPEITVETDVPGGTFVCGDAETPLEPEREYTFKIV